MDRSILYIAEHCELDCSAFIDDLFRVLRSKLYLTAMQVNAAQAQALLYQYSFSTTKRFILTVNTLIQFLNKYDSPYTFKKSNNVDKERRWCLKLK